MSGKAIPGSRCIGYGGMQEKKPHIGRTPRVVNDCNIKRCNGGLGPDQGGKGVDTLIAR